MVGNTYDCLYNNNFKCSSQSWLGAVRLDVINDKRWQDNSDGWVKTMNESKERKEKMERLEAYEVTIPFTQDRGERDPFDWIQDALDESAFKEKAVKILATDVSPLDIWSDDNKWMRDASQS